MGLIYLTLFYFVDGSDNILAKNVRMLCYLLFENTLSILLITFLFFKYVNLLFLILSNPNLSLSKYRLFNILNICLFLKLWSKLLPFVSCTIDKKALFIFLCSSFLYIIPRRAALLLFNIFFWASICSFYFWIYSSLWLSNFL